MNQYNPNNPNQYNQNQYNQNTNGYANAKNGGEYTPPNHLPVRDNNPTGYEQQTPAPKGFSYNAKEAAEGSVMGARMESGAYFGMITHCQHIVASKKGTEGIMIEFEASTGQKTTLRIFYIKQIQAISHCIGFHQDLQPMSGQVKEYNQQTGKLEEKPGYVYPQLVNQPIGMVLQGEEYIKNDGNVGWRMSLAAPFDHHSRRTAREMLENVQQPRDVEQLLKSIQAMDAQKKPLKPKKPQGNTYNHQAQQEQPPAAGSWAASDEDIPF